MTLGESAIGRAPGGVMTGLTSAVHTVTMHRTCVNLAILVFCLVKRALGVRPSYAGLPLVARHIYAMTLWLQAAFSCLPVAKAGGARGSMSLVDCLRHLTSGDVDLER